MERGQSRPDGERGGKLLIGAELADYGEIAGGIRRQHVVENRVDIGIHAPATRKGFRAALRIDVDGAADFRESLRDLSLAKKKISVTPGDFRGERISAFGLEESVGSRGGVPFRFVGRSEVHPGVHGARIESERGA